jgi:hypothetical protein
VVGSIAVPPCCLEVCSAGCQAGCTTGYRLPVGGQQYKQNSHPHFISTRQADDPNYKELLRTSDHLCMRHARFVNSEKQRTHQCRYIKAAVLAPTEQSVMAHVPERSSLVRRSSHSPSARRLPGACRSQGPPGQCRLGPSRAASLNNNPHQAPQTRGPSHSQLQHSCNEINA